eukprot:1940375-Prymnesium_polylepis.1
MALVGVACLPHVPSPAAPRPPPAAALRRSRHRRLHVAIGRRRPAQLGGVLVQDGRRARGYRRIGAGARPDRPPRAARPRATPRGYCQTERAQSGGATAASSARRGRAPA